MSTIDMRGGLIAMRFMQATDPTKPYNPEKAGPIMGFFFNTFLTLDMTTGKADLLVRGRHVEHAGTDLRAAFCCCRGGRRIRDGYRESPRREPQ